jgi:hypothetical protein
MNLRILNNQITKVDLQFLENFQFSNGRKFPKSYREFAKKYGYGLLCDLFIIYVPLGDYCDSWINQTSVLKETFHDFISNDWYLTLEPDGDESLILDAVPFGKSENGEFLFWNISSEPQKDEFDIYITDFGGIGVIKIAESMSEFINKITNLNLDSRINEFVNHSLPQTFLPLPIIQHNN